MPTFQGTPNSDVVTGGAGDDIIIGGLGSDQLTGGAGIDRFVFTGWQDSRTDAIDTIMDLTTGVDRIDLTQIAGLRLVRLLWDGANTTLLAGTATGLMRVNITGRVVAADVLTAAGVTIQEVQLNLYVPGQVLNSIGPSVTGYGADYSTGTSGADNLSGGDGVGAYFSTWNDVLDGQGGNDVITAYHWDWAFGGDGNDTFTTGFPLNLQSNRPGGSISYPTGIQAILTGGTGSDRFVMADEAARITDFTVSGPEADSLWIGQTLNPVIGQSVTGAVVGQWLLEGVNARDLVGRIFRTDGSLYVFDTTTIPDLPNLVAGQVSVQATGARYQGQSTNDRVDYTLSVGPVTVVIGATETTVTSGGLTDTLVSIEAIGGSAFADTFTGGGANVSVYGGAGDDRITITGSSRTLYGGAGDDRIEAGTSNTDIYGDEGNDWLIGGTSYDRFFGGPGADRMDGGPGEQPIGGDTVEYRESGTGIVIDLNGGVGRGGFAEGDTLTRIENIYGSAFDDVITGSAANNILWAGAGDDVLYGGAGNDSVLGEDGADLMYGGAGADRFTMDLYRPASGGYDVIADFETGVDRFDTGNTGQSVSIIRSGGNTYMFAPSSYGTIQTVFLNAVINGSDMSVSNGLYMVGSDSSEILIGSYYDDSIVGGLGDDIIAGGGGGDMMSGGAGADDFRYLNLYDSTNVNYANYRDLDNLYDFETGIDTITVSSLPVESVSIIRTDDGSSVVFAQCNDQYRNQIVTSAVGRAISAADIVYTGTFGVYMVGSSLGETLVGSTRNDPLQGNGGNDILIGGLGADVLFGGAGADVFQYRTAAESTANAAGSDTIFDMVSGLDKIDLRGVRTGASDAFGIAHLNGSSFLFVDLGGNGVNDMLIQLANVTLLASDILWSAQATAEEPAVKPMDPEVLPTEIDADLGDGLTSIGSHTGRFMLDLDPTVGKGSYHGQDWYL